MLEKCQLIHSKMNPIYWISILEVLEVHDQSKKVLNSGPRTPTLKKPATPNYAGEKGPRAQAKATNTSREPEDPRNEILNS